MKREVLLELRMIRETLEVIRNMVETRLIGEDELLPDRRRPLESAKRGRREKNWSLSYWKR